MMTSCVRACVLVFSYFDRACDFSLQTKKKKMSRCIIYFATLWLGDFSCLLVRCSEISSTEWTHLTVWAVRNNRLYKNRSEPLNAENSNSINYTVYCMKNKVVLFHHIRLWRISQAFVQATYSLLHILTFNVK